MTLPNDVVEAAGLHPKDSVQWTFEDGRIVGRKMIRQLSHELDVADLDPRTLLPKKGQIVPSSLESAIRAERDRR